MPNVFPFAATVALSLYSLITSMPVKPVVESLSGSEPGPLLFFCCFEFNMMFLVVVVLFFSTEGRGAAVSKAAGEHVTPHIRGFF